MDFSRPTNNGITIDGKTTTSRKGNNGKFCCDIKNDLIAINICLLSQYMGTNIKNYKHINKKRSRSSFLLLNYCLMRPYLHQSRSEERRVGKECRSRWSP